MRPILNDKILKTIMRQKDQNIGYWEIMSAELTVIGRYCFWGEISNLEVDRHFLNFWKWKERINQAEEIRDLKQKSNAK
jgi:hypothetical protein